MKVKRIQCNHSTHVIVTDLITSDNEILNECESFYSNIYSSKTNSLDSSHLFFNATGL